MYIIAIAWMYVVTLMAATERTVTAGLLTFTFYGLLPCALFLWLLGVKHRQFKKIVKQATKRLLEDDVREPDSSNTKTDE